MLTSSRLRYVLGQGADLSNAVLDGADLRGADFTGAILDGASFTAADTTSSLGLNQLGKAVA
jgi:uncharacterized protein YjbI with pentapeptide repeats